jgi:putative ABC transport system permease protein
VFSADEERTAPKVAIIGAMAGERLFGTDDPMGQIVRILNTPFTVVGLLKPKGTSPEGRDQDDVIFIPITAAMTRLIGGEQSQS